jgi:transposase
MAKYRKYDPKQSQFFVLQPEKLLEENKLLARIDSFIEDSVDLESFSRKLNNDSGGAPAVDPRLLLKLLFYSYATGVYHSRDMEERTGWDVNYVYICGGQSVDHSTICNFLLDYSEEIKKIFTQVLYVGQNLGVVGMDFVAIDGTKIRANVDKEFTGTVEDFLQKKSHLEGKISERMEQTLQEDKAYRKRSEKKIEQMKRSKKRIEEFLEKVEKGEPDNGKIKSLTDLEASIVKDQDRKYPGYNCQAAVDDKHHMIIANEVTNEENDVHMLEPMIEESRRQTNNDLRNTDVGTDSGYSSSESLAWANKEELNLFMPSGRGPGGQQNLQTTRITSRHCEPRIDGDQRILICPGGQTMVTNKSIKTSRANNYTFEPDPIQCEGCNFKQICYSNIRKSKKKFIVRKDYFENLPLRQQMTEKLSSLKGKHRMADRSCLVEHVFGEIKELRSFRRFYHRGLKKVKLIWSLVCTAYNFRKLALLSTT